MLPGCRLRKMPPKKRKLNTKAVFRIYWRHTKSHPWLLAAALIGVALSQVDKVAGPIFLKQIFNLIVQGPAIPMDLITHVLWIFVGVSLVGWLGGRLEMWLGYTMIAKVAAALTKEAFDNLMHHSYQFFTNSFAGALTRRISRFGGAYENLYYSFISVLLEAALYIVSITSVLFWHSAVLGSAVLGWIVVFILLQWYMSRWQQPYRLARAAEDSNLVAALADSISNQNTVALFSNNAYEAQVVGRATDKFQQTQLTSWNINSIVYGIQGLFAIILNVGVLWLTVSLIRSGVLTTGDLILVQIYVFSIFGIVWGLGRQFQAIYNALADASEMVETMETPHEVKDRKNAKHLRVNQGEVWFDDVSFSFHKDAAVLHQFNLTIAGGERVALVGPSGAGKSTVTKLLLRLYDVNGGEIKIDKQDISKVTQDSLRDAIAFVPQEPILFHRTLMENIRYGWRDATDEQVVEAAKKAHCHEFISRLPDGYNTFVGERGIKLSGGERQRVAIARAILKDAPILVLDEATSSLDSESEALIQDALNVLMEGKTVIVIAHRLSTIMKMDRIVVMEQGAVVAQGTHLQLIKEQGLYQKLWSIQAGGFLGYAENTKEGLARHEYDVSEKQAGEDEVLAEDEKEE